MSTERDSRGVDMTTLAITAVASAGAAYACSKVWAPGTLPSAALTPVLVALIKETIRRPTEVVTRAVPVRGASRSARTHSRSDAPAPRVATPEEEPTRAVQPAATLGAPPPSRNSARWRLAVVTGLLGFVLAALALTVPELVADESASGGGRKTTIFGGETKEKKRERATPTTPAPTRTVNPPQRTVTVPPPTRTAPVPTTPAPPPASRTPTPPKPAPAPPAPIAP